jgi:hypothetical protein
LNLLLVHTILIFFPVRSTIKTVENTLEKEEKKKKEEDPQEIKTG